MFLLFAVAACSGSVNQVPCGAAIVTYNLDFPSTGAAIGAQTVVVSAFDATVKGNDCTSLLTVASTNQTLPTALAQTQGASLCDLFNNATDAVIPGVPFGTISFLAVTQRTGKNYFLGCSQMAISAPSSCSDAGTGVSVDIDLTAGATVAVPATTCTTVGQHCAAGSTC